MHELACITPPYLLYISDKFSKRSSISIYTANSRETKIRYNSLFLYRTASGQQYLFTIGLLIFGMAWMNISKKQDLSAIS